MLNKYKRQQIIMQFVSNSFDKIIDCSNQQQELIQKLKSRLEMKELNIVEIEQFMYHIQKQFDAVVISCDEILKQYQLSLQNNDEHTELLYELSQYLFVIKELIDNNRINLYKNIDTQLFDFRELNKFKEKIKYYLFYYS